MTHGDTVTDGDGVEFVGNTAGFADGITDDFTDFFQVAMPRYDIGIRVADTYQVSIDGGTFESKEFDGSLTYYQTYTDKKATETTLHLLLFAQISGLTHILQLLI